MKINLIKKHNLLMPYDTDAVNKIDSFKEGVIYQCEINNLDIRSISQNKLIHQFCKNVAFEAKKQNFRLKDLIKDGTEISMVMVKELMFKKLCLSLYGKESTTKLNKDELNLVFDSIILALGTKGMDTSNLLREEQE